MDKFRILFHGQFAKPQAQAEGIPGDDGLYEGFYAARVLAAASPEAAITRGRELIREELDATLLRGRQGDLISLDVEELEAVGSSDDRLPNKGFTFY
ncbi:MAG TPA: hypothetical protein VEA61_08080 [Allosphingosinicella sp.]|nr:hypothetical protein [Allosphingosinicella sp.]